MNLASPIVFAGGKVIRGDHGRLGLSDRHNYKSVAKCLDFGHVTTGDAAMVVNWKKGPRPRFSRAVVT